MAVELNIVSAAVAAPFSGSGNPPQSTTAEEMANHGSKIITGV